MTQNTAYPIGAISPATTSGAQLASFVDALRDNLYSNSLGATIPSYTKKGMLWSQQLTGQISIRCAVSPTVSVSLGTVDTTTNTFRVEGAELLKVINIGTSTAYTLSSTEALATIYEITGTPAANFAFIFPDGTTAKRLQFDNLTGMVATIRAASQITGVTIPSGKTSLMYYNGTKIEPATSAYLTADNPVVTGTLNAPTAVISAGTFSTSIKIPNSLTFSGTAIGTYGSLSLVGGGTGGIVGLDCRTGTLASNTAIGYMGFVAANKDFRVYSNTATEMFRCDTAGNITAVADITAFSDRSLKTDICTIKEGLETVKKLRGVTYTRKDTGEASLGVVADEVQEVLPEVVHKNIVEDKEILSVAYGNLVGVLIEAIKDLSEKVDNLSTKVERLENANRTFG